MKLELESGDVVNGHQDYSEFMVLALLLAREDLAIHPHIGISETPTVRQFPPLFCTLEARVYEAMPTASSPFIISLSGDCFTRTSRRFGRWCVHSHSLRPLGVGTLHFGISSALRRLVLFATCCIVVYKTIFPPALTASIVTEDSTRIGIVKS